MAIEKPSPGLLTVLLRSVAAVAVECNANGNVCKMVSLNATSRGSSRRCFLFRVTSCGVAQERADLVRLGIDGKPACEGSWVQQTTSDPCNSADPTTAHRDSICHCSKGTNSPRPLVSLVCPVRPTVRSLGARSLTRRPSHHGVQRRDAESQKHSV